MRMQRFICWLLLTTLATGCVSKTKARNEARAEAQRAYLAGQNDALKQQMAQQQAAVTVNGAVQNSRVPWVVGMTVTQAIATANYLGVNAPQQIILTRAGEDGVIDPQTLVNGVQIPVEPGDVITLK